MILNNESGEDFRKKSLIIVSVRVNDLYIQNLIKLVSSESRGVE